jgi:LPS export ABC transporter protein LptC
LLPKYIIILLLLLVSCSEWTNPNPKINPSKAEKLEPDQTATNLKIKFIDSAYTKAILIGDRGRVFNTLFKTIIDGNIRVEFFSKTSYKRISYLIADSLEIDDKTKDMLAYGKQVVVVSDSSQARLQTTVLQWKNKERKLFSKEFVKITSPRETLQGYGFESDENLSNYKIYKVTGEQR